jgi:hypothetical protein
MVNMAQKASMGEGQKLNITREDHGGHPSLLGHVPVATCFVLAQVQATHCTITICEAYVKIRTIGKPDATACTHSSSASVAAEPYPEGISVVVIS